MSAAETDRYPLRPLLFVALMALGLTYIATFVWLRQHSRDFVAADLNAQAMAAAALTATDTSLSFVAGGNAIGLLGSNWHNPSVDGTWSQSQGAVLFLPALVAGKCLHMEFATHFYGGEEPVWVHLDVDGHQVAGWNPTPWAHQVSADLRLPASVTADEPLRLQFRIERHAALFWHGVDPGARAYGIRLLAMQVGTECG